MQEVKQILIPLIADPVLSPNFVYGPVTGLYFTTTEEQYGRITFEYLDAVKICRGEMLPPPFDTAVRARRLDLSGHPFLPLPVKMPHRSRWVRPRPKSAKIQSAKRS